MSSLRNDRQLIRDVIRPALGTRKVTDLTPADMQRLHRSLSKTPYKANRALACFSKMLSLAVRWGVRSDNPWRGVERFKEEKRRRFLSSAELAKLGEVLVDVERERVEMPCVAPAIRLLLFTGARLSEILTLRSGNTSTSRDSA